MGTLTEQTYRIKQSFDNTYPICNEINDLMKTFDLTFEQALEVVKLSVTICDYDVKDEQLAGIGELLQDFVNQWSLPNAKMDN